MPDDNLAEVALSGAMGSAVAQVAGLAAASQLGLDPVTTAALAGMSGTLAQVATARFYRRVGTMLGEAGDTAELEPQELVSRILDDEACLDLLLRAVEEAVWTRDATRLRFYGRMLARGVLANDDGTIVDDSVRKVRSLAALDPVDLQVLNHMATREQGWLKYETDEHRGTIALDLPEIKCMIDAVFARLDTNGLILSSAHSEEGAALGASWTITPFGRACLAELRRLGDDEP